MFKEKMKQDLEKQTCPKCQQHSTVIINEKGVMLESCCQEFEEALYQQIRSAALQVDNRLGERGLIKVSKS